MTYPDLQRPHHHSWNQDRDQYGDRSEQHHLAAHHLPAKVAHRDYSFGRLMFH